MKKEKNTKTKVPRISKAKTKSVKLGRPSTSPYDELLKKMKIGQSFLIDSSKQMTVRLRFKKLGLPFRTSTAGEPEGKTRFHRVSKKDQVIRNTKSLADSLTIEG